MIEELRIRGLGVIEDAVVPFDGGFTVLTGETGAGKTMVLSGLGLIMGGKSDAGLLRSGAERADVDGVWRMPAESAVDILARVEEAGGAAEVEDGEAELLLGRSIGAGGRSRAFAGGRSVPASTLAEVTEALLAVHGQAEQLLLRDARRQRELLDRFGGLGDLVAGVAEWFTSWRALDRELNDLIAHRSDREREAALLRHGIDEIAAVEPVPGEDVDLKAQAQVLAHATDLLESVAQAHAALAGDDGEPGVADLVLRARRALERAQSLDPAMAALLVQLDGLATMAGAMTGELTAYADGLDADPQRLAEVEERRQALSTLKRRYGPELDDVLAWWAQAEISVAGVDGADERIAALTEQVSTAWARLQSSAAELSAARHAAGERFAAAVTAELHALAMPDARITVEVDTTDDPAAFTAEGADTVAFLLTPHSGSDARPLGRGASGGELSRIMLAIEVVLADVHRLPTFVFDEVDAGIGGKVAVEVGRRLARLARSSQVIVVTHLPQVAAFADRHVVVTKDRSGQVTESSVQVVEGPERVRELVRMLSGLEDSQSGAEHAAELLALAAADLAAADRVEPEAVTASRRKTARAPGGRSASRR
jgi:DNA repair protein RecN (Recombination protein N)